MYLLFLKTELLLFPLVCLYMLACLISSSQHVQGISDVVLGKACASAAGQKCRMLLEAVEDRVGGWRVKTVSVTSRQ